MKDKKKIVIGTLCALIMIMAVGYALLSQQLSINGTANITSTWKIEITNITEKERHGGVTEKSKSYDAMIANFDVGFTSPGDYITYDVEVTNSGTLDAVIERINVVTNDNPAIIYTTSGIERGTEIPHNTKKYLTVKIEYDSSVTSQPQTNNNALTVQLFTAQNLGQVQPDYDYVIGDLIEFAGSNWYVIKNSTEDEDYVTLLKEKSVAKNEITNAYANYLQCSNYQVQNNIGGCTSTQQYIKTSLIPFYWNDSCHFSGKYGNNTYYSSAYGCSGIYDYSNSKVKEFLEGTYINTLDSSNLKEVDGYKIRLITREELLENLGYDLNYNSGGPNICLHKTENVPIWVYEDFSNPEDIYNSGYWTMTRHIENTNEFWYVGSENGEINSRTIQNKFSIRPVINLLKSAIE